MSIKSKLADIGESIFAVNSRRARELNALNLGQGFPDYDIDPRLIELVAEAMRAGHNQYAPYEGVVLLREQIARQLSERYQIAVDPRQEVTITLGATEALFSAIQAVVHPGDEVIIFDPAYDSYAPAVRLAGGVCRHIALQPPLFHYDWDQVKDVINSRTRLIVFNTPQNPNCTVATPGDLQQLAKLAEQHRLYVLGDEVYEHMVFPPFRHESVLSHPKLRERSFAIYSFGKSLHSTGLRVGYCVAPPALTTELRKVHQFNTFSLPSATQQAVAQYLLQKPDFWRELSEFFRRKRDRFREALSGTLFELPAAQGTYFQLLDFSRVAPPGDLAFSERLLNEIKLSTIPLTPFYQTAPPSSMLRLCIAKRDSTLDDAAQRLRDFKP